MAVTNYRINEMLSKFENGVELYQTNALFANCVGKLLMGGDVYKILESVIAIHSEQQNRYKELLESGTLRQEIIVTKERFDEMLGLGVWNPASTPPRENKDVIAVVSDGTFFMARYSGLSGWGFYFLDNGLQFDDAIGRNVTHWMGLASLPAIPGNSSRKK